MSRADTQGERCLHTEGAGLSAASPALKPRPSQVQVLDSPCRPVQRCGDRPRRCLPTPVVASVPGPFISAVAAAARARAAALAAALPARHANEVISLPCSWGVRRQRWHRTPEAQGHIYQGKPYAVRARMHSRRRLRGIPLATCLERIPGGVQDVEEPVRAWNIR